MATIADDRDLVTRDTCEKNMKDIKQTHEYWVQKSVEINTGLLDVSRRMETNIQKLNDEFVLHNKDMKDVKQELMKWIKYLALALVVTLGGTQVVKILMSI